MPSVNIVAMVMRSRQSDASTSRARRARIISASRGYRTGGVRVIYPWRYSLPHVFFDGLRLLCRDEGRLSLRKCALHGMIESIGSRLPF